MTIRARCAAQCSLSAELLMPVAVRFAGGKRRITMNLLGKVSRTLKGDRTLEFTIALNRRGRRALPHSSRVTLMLQLSAGAGRVGKPTTSKLRVTLSRRGP